MSTSSLAQASLNERKKTITTTTTTTCTRTLFSKLSTTTTSSTSSISSVMNEVMNDVMMTPSLQQTINPFEETNKFRLEQSVLSPNLFQIASTSTPERENNGSMWNIEQRAVLYPADIPTDESSLIAQYIYDTRTAKQVSAAVEAFWSQNKVIIESPLASSNGTQAFGSNQLKNRLGTLSSSGASSANRNNFSSPLNLDAKSNKKNHRYATSSVGSLSNLARNNSATKLYESTKLNKKDQNCQTVLSFPIDLDLSQIPGLNQFLIKSPDHQKTNSPKLNNSIRKKLFDPDELSTSSTKNDSLMSPRLRQLHKNSWSSEPKCQVAGPAADLSFNDDWEDSFDFDKQAAPSTDKNHRSSSPKKTKKILCDMGSDHEPDLDLDQDDSVFLVEHKKLDLSPVGPDQQTPQKITDMSVHKMDLSLLSNSIFSKNLQHKHHNRIFHFDAEAGHHADCTNEPLINSPNLSPISQKKSPPHLNSSSDSQHSQQQQKSIIFMDYSKSSEKPRQTLTAKCRHGEQHRPALEEDTYEQLIRKAEMQSRDVNRTVLLQNSSSTTTTTINQSDTGYQTNCFGANGTNNSSNATNGSEMMLFKKASSLGLPPTNQQNSQEQLTSSPLTHHKFDKTNKHFLSKSCDKNENSSSSSGRQEANRNKLSLSLNSFERMQPIECSTPEKLKSEMKREMEREMEVRGGQRVGAVADNSRVFKVYDCSSGNNLDCSMESEESCGVKRQIVSMLNGESASEYARTVIDRAKQELMATSFYFNATSTNRTNRV